MSVCIWVRKLSRSSFHESRIDACICRSEARATLLLAKVASRVSMRVDIMIVVVVSGEGGIGEFSGNGSVGAN